MKESGRLYLHRASIGDEAACVSVNDATLPVLKDAFARGRIAGYRMFVIRDVDDANEESLSFMFDYESETGRKFPFVFAGVQPPDDSSFDFDALMRGQDFERVG